MAIRLDPAEVLKYARRDQPNPSDLLTYVREQQPQYGGLNMSAVPGLGAGAGGAAPPSGAGGYAPSTTGSLAVGLGGGGAAPAGSVSGSPLSTFAQTVPTPTSYGNFAGLNPAAFGRTPGSQYLQNEQQKAIQRSAAARGSLLTGGLQKRLQENAAGLAAQDFQNAFNRELAGYETNRATNAQNFGQQMASYGGGLDAFRANTGALTDADRLALQRAQFADSQERYRQEQAYRDAQDQRQERAYRDAQDRYQQERAYGLAQDQISRQSSQQAQIAAIQRDAYERQLEEARRQNTWPEPLALSRWTPFKPVRLEGYR